MYIFKMQKMNIMCIFPEQVKFFIHCAYLLAHLYIVFDPLCVTNRDDTLQLWKGQYKEEPLTDLISGPSQQKWPATPLIVSGDNVLFEFKSSQFSVPRWGYR